MSQEIRIPDIGDADDVEVVEILVGSGDEVGEDDPIIVIESDKASMEVPAGVSGTIDSVTVAVGDKVAEGQVIAKLKESDVGATSSVGANSSSRMEEAIAPDRDGSEEKPVRGREAAPTEAEAAPTEAEAAPTEAEAAPTEAETAPTEAEATPTEAEATPTEAEAASPEAEGAPAEAQEVQVKVPDIGDADNVEVIEVAVKPGDQVNVDDMLVVVESDKASMEIPSSHAGTVKDVHVQVGTEVEEGTLLVTLLWERPPGRESSGTVRDREAAPTEGKEADRDREIAPTKEPARPEPAPEIAAPPSSGTSVYAGPAVRRLARELGVDLTAVEGTGNRGRIVKDDVKAYVKRRMAGDGAAPAGAAAAWPGLPEVDFSKFGEIEEQPLSRTRARGAENLHRSWINLPHVTQHDEVDVTDLEDFRAGLRAESERRSVKVTPVAFIIRACCHVLKEFPTFNASLDPAAKTFILKRYYNIGMAVDTPEGLVVPVIRDADSKGVWELSAEVAELAEKAREKKLTPGDMQGGSFSVSSLGAIGGTGFTPIINAPEVAILGVGRLTVRPVWRDDTFLPRKMLPLSLSYDHRAINGAEAGRFVARLGEILSDIRHLAL